jgi:hypothetical protein
MTDESPKAKSSQPPQFTIEQACAKWTDCATAVEHLGLFHQTGNKTPLKRYLRSKTAEKIEQAGEAGGEFTHVLRLTLKASKEGKPARVLFVMVK